MTKIQNPKQLLRKYNIRPSKQLGQNFLIDRGVLRKIIAAAELCSKDTVLEIGPGLGILTIELAKRAKQVIAIEKDRTLCEALKDILEDNKISNVKVVNKDVLQISNYSNLPNYSKQIPMTNYKIVANLPYYIVSPVIRKFLEAKNKPQLMVLMVQKEVAQRIIAQPPKMNLLAIAIQFYCSPPHQKFGSGGMPKIISYVSKKSFYPQPKVDSAIIKIIPQPIPKVDTKKFFNLVKVGFSSKRKMLVNNLSKKFKIQKGQTTPSLPKFKILLEGLCINPKARAENLSIKDWLRLFHRLNLD